MKFNLKISRLNNLYFFAVNLTEFHHSCRPHFNREWLKATGRLNDQEKKAIAELKQISRKYGFEFKNNKSIYLGRYFYCPDDKDKWLTVKKYLSSLEYDKFYNSLTVLETRFNKIYNEDLLKKWGTKLEQELNSKRFVNLYNSTKKFLEPKKLEPFLNIHLLISPSLINSASGGANLGTKNITLEVPVFQILDWQIEQAANILMHELAHIWFEYSSGYQLTKKLTLDNFKHKKSVGRDSFSLVKERIVESIAPFGYPCQIYSDKVKPLSEFLLPNLPVGYQAYKNFRSGRQADYRKLNYYLSWFTYPLVADYFYNNKKIDNQFIKEAIKSIQ